jgi:RNA polymerase sigma-70 factor (ECF subfamily)
VADARTCLDETLRADGARLRATLIALTRDFEAAEDALQEASARALEVWPRDGLPDRPGAWLNTVARRVALDGLRRMAWVELETRHEPTAEPDEPAGIEDDLLRLLFTCCHPALSSDGSVPLALKMLCGMSNSEIARAFGLREAAVAQRIVRAKRKIRRAGIAFELPREAYWPERLDAVLAVIYALFNEGYVATTGGELMRPRLCREAIRLGRLVVALMPEQAEGLGLLALMLLVDARSAGRVDGEGRLVPLERQDRSRWNAEGIDEGCRLLDRAMERRRPGPYQVEAAIAALHSRARHADDTDWAQIRLLYRRLLALRPGPVVALNAAVAEAMVDGPAAGLARIDRLQTCQGDAGRHLLHAARADLLRRLGRFDAAAASYRRALVEVDNAQERRYLERRLAELAPGAPPGARSA